MINEINCLTKENYSETLTAQIIPEAKYQGMHTMNFIDDLHVYDFLVKE